MGLVLYVCAGSEGSAILPLEMLNEGYKASSPGMVIGDVRFKGGMYVELTHTNQHVENIYVDTIATENYEAFCGMAHDVPARNDLSTELVINPGICGAIPGKQAKCLVTRQSLLYMLLRVFGAECVIQNFAAVLQACHPLWQVHHVDVIFRLSASIRSFCCTKQAFKSINTACGPCRSASISEGTDLI